MMTPISEKEKEIVEFYNDKLKIRNEYENTLLDEIIKRDRMIHWLKTVIGSLAGIIIMMVIAIIFS